MHNNVVGLSDVREGYRPLYPVTVYFVSGDDTSGIAGLLFPSGDFRPVPTESHEAMFWEYDETDRYKTIIGYDGKKRVVGHSWRFGQVVWNSRAGDIVTHIPMITEVNTLAGEPSSEEEDEAEVPGLVPVKLERRAVVVNRRLNDTNALTGDWITTGELWKAMERGTAMYGGKQAGRVHVTFGEEGGGFAGMPSHRRAA